MLTSVNHLSNVSLKNTVISENINEILSLINRNILKENTLGNNQIVFNLPVVFRNVNISHEMASIIIYTSVVKELKNKGYEVKIKQDPNHPCLYIKWVSGVSSSEIDLMREFLNEHNI